MGAASATKHFSLNAPRIHIRLPNEYSDICPVVSFRPGELMFETYGVKSVAFGTDAAFAYGYNASKGSVRAPTAGATARPTSAAALSKVNGLLEILRLLWRPALLMSCFSSAPRSLQRHCGNVRPFSVSRASHDRRESAPGRGHPPGRRRHGRD